MGTGTIMREAHSASHKVTAGINRQEIACYNENVGAGYGFTHAGRCVLNDRLSGSHVLTFALECRQSVCYTDPNHAALILLVVLHYLRVMLHYGRYFRHFGVHCLCVRDSLLAALDDNLILLATAGSGHFSDNSEQIVPSYGHY